MSDESQRKYLWVGVAVDVLIVLPVGIWLMNSGRTEFGRDFGDSLLVVGSIGLVATLVQLWRLSRQRDEDE